MALTVGIAGAGLMGRLAGFLLAQAGCKVTLFDRDRTGRNSCSYIGAGMLAPFAELEKAEPVIAALGQKSLALWPKILAKLPQPVFFQEHGSLVLAHGNDRADLRTFATRVGAKLEDPQHMRWINQPRLTELEPELSARFGEGLFFPNEGQIEPRQLIPALKAGLQATGAQIREAQIDWVGQHQLQADGTVETFDWVVDARGLGARPDWPQLRGVRGELIRIQTPEVRLNRPVRLMHPRYPLYIVPRPQHQFLLGATSIESDDPGPITVRSCLELLSAAYSLHPGFAEAVVMETAVQLRPALPDHLPKIQCRDGLLRINGLYRHGFLIAPALAATVCSLIGNTQPADALHTQILEVEEGVTSHGKW